MKHKERLLLFILIGLFFILRLPVLFSHIEELYEQEELYRGTVAREIIQGPKMSLWEYLDYKVEYFPGGTLVVGIIAVPFFLLFGQTYVSLKLVGLSFAFGTFILWYLFLKRFFSKTSAVFAALLFIFCVPFYTKSSLITWGAHPEANFFSILSIFIFFKIFFRESGAASDVTAVYRNHGKAFFALGLIAGFAVWFVQTYLLTLFLIFLFWFVFDHRLLLRGVFYIFCLGFIVGFSPAIYYQFLYQGDVMSINGSNPLFELIFSDINKILPKLISLITVDLPNSFLFERFIFIGRETFSYAYYFIFLFSFGYVSWSNRKYLVKVILRIFYPITLRETTIPQYISLKESFLLFFTILFVFAYSMSNYTLNPEHWLNYIGYRYMIPLMPFIFAIIALFLDKIYEKKIVCNMLLAFLLTIGIAGNLSLISLKTFGIYFHDKGYSYSIIGDKIGLRVIHNLKGYIAPFNRLEPTLKMQFYEGLGSGIAWRIREDKPAAILGIIESEIAPEYRFSCYKGWGMLFSPENDEDFDRAMHAVSVLADGYKPAFYEGFGRNMNFFDNMNYTFAVLEKIDVRYKPYCYKGIGYGIGFRYKNEPAKQIDLINMIDKRYRQYVYKGIMEGESER